MNMGRPKETKTVQQDGRKELEQKKLRLGHNFKSVEFHIKYVDFELVQVTLCSWV